MTDVFGLVLAGGKSSRMGFDKSTLVFHHQPQGEFLFNLLGNYCTKVFTSCRVGQPIASRLNPIFDRFEIESPLNGILSALTSEESTAWLTAPVDMPGIDAETVEYLTALRDRNKMATCFFDSEGVQPEPLFVIWEIASLPSLLDFAKKGGASPREFLKKASIKIIESPFSRLHVNVNSPEDWIRWKAQNSPG